MNNDRSLTIRIPEALLSSTMSAARVEDMTAAEFIRIAVADRVAELGGAAKRDAVGMIRRALRRDFSEARDWLDLQRRLRAQKLVIRKREGQLWLFTWPIERKLVALTRLGVSEEDLTILYRTSFPSYGTPAPRLSGLAA